MTTNPITIEQVRQGDVIRFRPFTRKSAVRVVVAAVTESPLGSLCFVHGVRVTPRDTIDSQSQRHAWPIEPGTEVEVEEGWGE